MNHALPLGCSRRLPALARLRLADHRSGRLEAQGRPERLEVQDIQTSVNDTFDMYIWRYIYIYTYEYIYVYIYIYIRKITRIKRALRTRRGLHNHIMGLYYMTPLWNYITGSYYGIVLRNYITG